MEMWNNFQEVCKGVVINQKKITQAGRPWLWDTQKTNGFWLIAEIFRWKEMHFSGRVKITRVKSHSPEWRALSKFSFQHCIHFDNYSKLFFRRGPNAWFYFFMLNKILRTCTGLSIISQEQSLTHDHKMLVRYTIHLPLRNFITWGLGWKCR